MNDAQDAARYRWLRARLLAADFDYAGEGITALVFELPARCTVSADCDAVIDEAMAMDAPASDLSAAVDQAIAGRRFQP